jgi:hypothetical protein
MREAMPRIFDSHAHYSDQIPTRIDQMAKAVTLPDLDSVVVTRVTAVPIPGAAIGRPLYLDRIVGDAAAYWEFVFESQPAFRRRILTKTCSDRDMCTIAEPFWDTAYRMPQCVHWICLVPPEQLEGLPEAERAGELARIIHAADKYNIAPPVTPPTLAGVCEIARIMAEGDHDEEEEGPFPRDFYAVPNFRAAACVLDIGYRPTGGDFECTTQCQWALIASVFRE